MSRQITYCAGLLFLAGLWTEDIRDKKISGARVMISALLALLFRLLTGTFLWEEIIGSLLPGSMLLMLAFLTKESIGYGDGMAVLALGSWVGGWLAMAAVCFGVMLSGFFGMICLLRKQKEPIPFIPFLLLGMEVAFIYA